MEYIDQSLKQPVIARADLQSVCCAAIKNFEKLLAYATHALQMRRAKEFMQQFSLARIHF